MYVIINIIYVRAASLTGAMTMFDKLSKNMAK